MRLNLVVMCMALLGPTCALGQSTPWNIPLGKSLEETVESFQHVGTADKVMWARSGSGDNIQLRFVCSATNACFSIPARGDFVFWKKQLAEASISVQREQAPNGYNVVSHLMGIKAKSGLSKPAALVRAVGRRTEYHLFDGYTVVWVQDGADAQVKLYLDALSPIGRAEAVAAGAETKLDHLPGAKLFAQAHKAVVDGRWDAAATAFEALLDKGKKVPPLLLEQARFLLAMSIAAHLKARGREGPMDPAKVRAELDRARKLAPSLESNLNKLQEVLIKPGGVTP